MKGLLIIAVLCLFISCAENSKMDTYIVETSVNLQKGKTMEVLELFKSTNPQLVSNEEDWIKASFSSVEGKDIIIVRAEWKSKKSYLKFSNSKEFKDTMKEFGRYFKGKPKVTFSKVLFEM